MPGGYTKIRAVAHGDPGVEEAIPARIAFPD
jgi:hypothetical protein